MFDISQHLLIDILHSDGKYRFENKLKNKKMTTLIINTVVGLFKVTFEENEYIVLKLERQFPCMYFTYQNKRLIDETVKNLQLTEKSIIVGHNAIINRL